MDTKKLTDAALKDAAKEAAAFKAAVISEQKDACNGVRTASHNDKVVDRHLARQALDAKVDTYLQAHGVDTHAPKTQSDNAEGYHLKINIIDAVERAANKKLTLDDTVCPSTPNHKKGGGKVVGS